jgi:two-component system, sensor histidine kinase SagS
MLPPSAQEPRILVVEDNVINQRVVFMQLMRLGYICDIVGSAAEALDALEQQVYHLVLLDCRLPDMDGVDFVQAVRGQSNKPWSSIVIIAVTADLVNFSRERCLASGMDDWLSKPFRMEQLSETIGQWLG